MGEGTVATYALEELLPSTLLSRVALSFGDDEPPPRAPRRGGANDRDSPHRRRTLNAAKLSLLAVAAVRGLLLLEESSSNDRDAAERRAAGLRPSDFTVRLRHEACEDRERALGGNFDGRCFLLKLEISSLGENDVATVERGGDAPSASPRLLKNVGRILRAIFDFGRGSAMAETSARDVGEISGDERTSNDESPRDGERHASKSRRNDRSLFATLLGTGEYPVSVCRLLSDLMDDSGDGENEARDLHEFASLDEVLRDLEQMANDPQIFLYDPGSEFHSAPLHFGRGHYGRAKETAQLVGPSDRPGTDDDDGGTPPDDPTGPPARNPPRVAFVSGVAGSGKSSLARRAGDVLSGRGWIVARAKFQRGRSERASRDVAASLFEGLVAALLAATGDEGGGEADGEAGGGGYGRRATAAIADALDPSSLSCLANFVPNIQDLMPGVDQTANRLEIAEHWQLVFLLSNFVGAILTAGRPIMICLDDLQWCDGSTMLLISDFLSSMSQRQGAERRSRLLTVGIYRDDEVPETHPLASQLAVLKKSKSIHVTEIKLAALAREDITDMLMTELRLPRRLVIGLAATLHKKTMGHAMSVVQLLNSLVRDSVIAYSPRKHRFDWDQRALSALKTANTVASMVVADLSRRQPGELRTLGILSCFGVQVDTSLIRLVDGSDMAPRGGFEILLPALVEQGVLEASGPVISFSHDLIQQHVYESIPTEERRHLHHDLGVFLGSFTSLDVSTEMLTSDGGFDRLNLSDGSTGSNAEPIDKPSTLASIVTEQINAAGPDFIIDPKQRTRFAGWNLHAGKEAGEGSNFQAALFNYANGIAFLADRLWRGDAAHQQLCRELHQGAAFASFALGDAAGVELYAQAVMDNVPLEDSLLARALLIRSRRNQGKYEEVIATGLAVLRLLKIDIPSAPSPITVLQSMEETKMVTSQYTSAQIANLKLTSINDRKRDLLKIVDVLAVACYRTASPFLPLVACAMVNYSLQNGVCEESATAFVVYGYFHIFLSDNFQEGRRWGEITKEIMAPNSVFTSIVLYGYLLFLFMPHREVALILMEAYETGMKVGDVDNAMHCLTLSMRLTFFGGGNLSLLSTSYANSLRKMSKYSQECLKHTIVDAILVEGLTGINSGLFSAFDGVIQNESILLADAHQNNSLSLIESIHMRRFFSAFWREDYDDADKWYNLVASLPSFKMPKIGLIYLTFYRGLISFQRYRDGDGEEWLAEGTKALEKMRVWNANASKDIFESKLYLLESEDYACNCNIVASRESYELSAKTARDKGLVHEQGLAYEMCGKFLSSIADIDSVKCFQKALHCYVSWGAIVKAEKIRKDRNVDVAGKFMRKCSRCTYGLNRC